MSKTAPNPILVFCDDCILQRPIDSDSFRCAKRAPVPFRADGLAAWPKIQRSHFAADTPPGCGEGKLKGTA